MDIGSVVLDKTLVKMYIFKISDGGSMKDFFSINSPLMTKLGYMADLFLINILFSVCSIPIITGGAAFAGMQKVCMMKVLTDDEPIIKPFFKAFKSNFKYATIVWIFNVIAMALPILYLQFVKAFFSGIYLTVVNSLILVFLCIFIGVYNYMMMLIVRYENTLKEHLKNAWLLSLGFFPRTVVIVAVNLIPLAIAYLDLNLFFETFIIWLLVGTAAIRDVSCRMLKPVTMKLEELQRNSEKEVYED